MAAPRWRAPLVTWPAPKLNLAVMGSAYLVFGFSLVLQPHRWESTPAYHILLAIFQAQAWGALFITSGAALGAAAWQFGHRRWVVITSLTLAFTLTTGWMLAFVTRYLTSPSTTPVTWVSWAIFAFLLVKVAISVDHSAPPPPATGPEIDDFRQAIDDALTAAAEDQRGILMRDLAAWSDRSRDAVGAACAAYGQALRAIIPAGAMPASGDLAQQAINEARNALLRAEEAYSRATGQPADPADEP